MWNTNFNKSVICDDVPFNTNGVVYNLKKNWDTNLQIKKR